MGLNIFFHVVLKNCSTINDQLGVTMGFLAQGMLYELIQRSHLTLDG
jgi:hypothetical protein